MKTLKLLDLRLINFKGIKDFSLKANGENVNVHGNNGTGKTTLFDAFTWLLFGKDSNNRKDFSIKPLDNEGKVIHNIANEVEAVFEIDGETITLKKVYEEHWAKKKGSASKEFKGNRLNPFINDVPVKVKEYNERVAEIVEEDVFKLLTSPSYFNEQLHWKERRQILLDIAGDVSDEEVISSNKDLSALNDALSGRSIEEHKKMVASKKSKINKELESIPDRINEVVRAMPEVESENEADLQAEVERLEQAIEDKKEEKSRVLNGGEVSEKEKALREVEGELLDIKNQFQSDNYTKINQKKKELSNLQFQLDEIKRNIIGCDSDIQQQDNLINKHNQRMSDLREQWSNIDAEAFDETKTTCPTCQQNLPEEDIESAREHFNQHKSQRLENINQEGKSLKEEVERANKEIERLEHQREDLEQEQKDLEYGIAGLETDIEAMTREVSNAEDSEEYQEALKRKETIQQDIQTIRDNASESVNHIEQELSTLRNDLSSVQRGLSQFEQIERLKERKAELEEQQKTLASEYEQLESELYLADEFIRTKINLLEDKINDKFNHAHFKMFHEQVNGGLEETCETLYNGVPYGSGLNNAARINVGLDIINTLSDYYQFQAPIFIDNAEAVTQLADTNSQIVRLVVSGSDDKLRVEHAKESELV